MKTLNFLRKYLCCGKNILCKKTFGKFKTNPYLYSRIGYFIILLLTLIYCVIEIEDQKLILPFENYLECNFLTKDSTYNCLEISSFYRISFASIIIHLICCIIALGNNKTLKLITQTEFWPLKFIILSSIYYFSFYIPNNFFGTIAFFSKFLSVIYLTYQLILIIYFAHILNITLINGFDKYKENGIFKCAIISFTLLFSLISICFIVLSVFDYEHNALNITLISMNLIFGLVNIIISISDIVKDKRFLTSICIFSYSCYTTWAAIHSQPINNENNKGNLYMDYTEVSFGLIYVLMALIFISFCSKRKFTNKNLNINSEDNNSDYSSNLVLNIQSIRQETENSQEIKELMILERCHILVNNYEFEYSEGK